MKKNILLCATLALILTTASSQTITDFDGNVYNTIVIGTQVWMKENLKTTHYRNGNTILKVSNATTWYNLFNTGGAAMCYYNNDSAANANVYGALYNWHAAHSNSYVCPANWHVPTDAEWTILTDYLYNNGYAYQGTGFEIAKAIAATSGWNPSATAGAVGNNPSSNDSTHFSALPGGSRSEYGTYSNLLSSAYWWSNTTDDGFHAWARIMQSNSAYVTKNPVTKEVGASVRCICDFLTTDIRGNDKNSDFTLFPNPSTGLINISFSDASQDIRVDVLNSCGQVILSKDITHPALTILDLSGHSKGLYFIKVQTSRGVFMSKAMVE